MEESVGVRSVFLFVVVCSSLATKYGAVIGFAARCSGNGVMD